MGSLNSKSDVLRLSPSTLGAAFAHGPFAAWQLSAPQTQPVIAQVALVAMERPPLLRVEPPDRTMPMSYRRLASRSESGRKVSTQESLHSLKGKCRKFPKAADIPLSQLELRSVGHLKAAPAIDVKVLAVLDQVLVLGRQCQRVEW